MRSVAQHFLGWKYRDYLTNSWVGSCPELLNRFHLARFPIILYVSSEIQVIQIFSEIVICSVTSIIFSARLRRARSFLDHFGVFFKI